MTMTMVRERIQINAELPAGGEEILTLEAKSFLTALHHNFNSSREELLAKRDLRKGAIEKGVLPGFLAATAKVRDSKWVVARTPLDLEDRRVEITGPTERKMMINALNSGAKVFMADLEDSLSPTWANVVEGQQNLRDAVRKRLSFTSPEGKSYQLQDQVATLVVRPRGLHLTEQNVVVDGKPMAASLFDFGLYFFHNAEELLKRESGPYFYLPKMESHLEARWWNEVFTFAEDWKEIRRGTIRATVLIETIFAAFEMDEILYELRDHVAGLNAGRWDYIFSIIKKFNNNKAFLFPDRAQISMSVPFMRAYAQLLVKTCHRRGAHAIGGMAAFIPSRSDAQINEIAFAKVKEDKLREAGDGFDGTWVAHPDLVNVAKSVFDQVLASSPHQKTKLREDFTVTSGQLLDVAIEGGKVTLEGVSNNVDVALQYIESWLRGRGAAAIYNLMEDAATAEISRAQIWQWIHHGATTITGEKITFELYRKYRDEHLEKLSKPGSASGDNRFKEATEILDFLVSANDFVEFLTIPAYEYLSKK